MANIKWWQWAIIVLIIGAILRTIILKAHKSENKNEGYKITKDGVTLYRQPDGSYDTAPYMPKVKNSSPEEWDAFISRLYSK